MAVLEYPTQQRLLLPWLGWCFALHFTGQRFRDSYQRFLRGDETVPLGVLHMESSGLKALITQRVSDGIETIRKLCGGHGYSALSGLPEISNNYLALCTLEGTAQVLEPQTARYLLRAYKASSIAAPHSDDAPPQQVLGVAAPRSGPTPPRIQGKSKKVSKKSRAPCAES